MPRIRPRKTLRGSISLDVINAAANDVTNDGFSIRRAATIYGIHYSTLGRYIKKKVKSIEIGSTLPTIGYQSHTRVFNAEQDMKLVDYVSKASDIYFGLTPHDIRKLAYELSIENDIRIPQNWTTNKCAGADWCRGFIDRHPNLSIRHPQRTNLGFNETNVTRYFDRLGVMMDRYKFEAGDIWNMDECGMTPLQKSSQDLRKNGRKQGAAGTSGTSGETGILPTIAIAVNALGQAIPPFFIFPQKLYHDNLIRDGPPGSAGTANTSGLMQELEFIEFLQHFVKFTKSSIEHKCLLLLDNHQSHLSIKTLDFCKESGIILLSFPPRCAHRLQPLERSLFGKLKKFLNIGSDTWMYDNPGKTMTVQNISAIVKSAFSLAITPHNITTSFRSTGIFPLNRNIFTENDFEPSTDTDEPLPRNIVETNDTSVNIEEREKTSLVEYCTTEYASFSETERPSNVTS